MERAGKAFVEVEMIPIPLRDYFAAKALQGLLPKLPLIDQQGEHGSAVADKIAHNLDIAESCYWLADAMLIARESKLDPK